MIIPHKSISPLIPYLFAFIFGCLHALFLSFTRLGRFLAKKRGWITVVIGVGGDLLIALPFLPLALWLKLLGVIAASSVPIVVRSLLQEQQETAEVLKRINRHA